MMAEGQGKQYPVRVVSENGESKDYPAEFQTSVRHSEEWKGVLRRARQDRLEVLCQCPSPAEKPLSVHYRSDTDHYHLSKYPYTGQDHAKDCAFYEPESAGDESKSGHSLESEAQGTLTKIRLDIGLTRRPAGTVERSGTGREAGVAHAQGREIMKLSNLLRLLWGIAGLNEWTPNMKGKRNFELAFWRLGQAAATIEAGGKVLADAMLLSTMAENGKRAEENAEKVKLNTENNGRILVAAPLAKFKPGADKGKSLPIYGFHGIPRLLMDTQAWERIEKKFLPELTAWQSGHRVIALAHADVPAEGKAAALDVALMRVNEQWIPVDSDIEALIANKLFEEDRRFGKPLATEDGQKLPSFWLRDVQPGRASPLVVMDAKAEPARAIYYGNKYGQGNWWSWDGKAGNMPAFPSKHAAS